MITTWKNFRSNILSPCQRFITGPDQSYFVLSRETPGKNAPKKRGLVLGVAHIPPKERYAFYSLHAMVYLSITRARKETSEIRQVRLSRVEIKVS